MSKHTLLYTEMITTGAILHGDRERLLAFNDEEHPVAIQLGGSDPIDLAACAKLAEQRGYDEINLNCGCPSDRVQSGMFGACLMAQPTLVADCIKAMRDAVSIPVTIKHRIGIDDQDEYQDLTAFVDAVAAAGCKTFIVHARKAWLDGLSPKENREIPPLMYERVYQLKQQYPSLEIIINGGITDFESCDMHLQQVDGVMMGREAYQNPYILAGVDQHFFNSTTPTVSRDDVLKNYIAFCEREMAKGTRLNHLTRHILGLYHGQHGGKIFRRVISENVTKTGATPDLLWRARDAKEDSRQG